MYWKVILDPNTETEEFVPADIGDFMKSQSLFYLQGIPFPTCWKFPDDMPQDFPKYNVNGQASKWAKGRSIEPSEQEIAEFMRQEEIAHRKKLRKLKRRR